MCDSARLYNCVRCHQQVIICSHCDRGNIYCADGCAQKAREEKQKSASRRYQDSTRGRHCHANRQRQYRQRQREKVTHQCSSQLSAYDLLLSEPKVLVRAVDLFHTAEKSHHICHFCGRDCGNRLRFSFLQQQTTRITHFGFTTVH